jgi:V/A-type H+-transporting ATPase subunit I
MAIVSMQKLSVCANKKHRKAILEALQAMGAMEVFTDQIDEEGLLKMDTASRRAQFERTADAFDQALKKLKEYAPENKKGIAALTGKDVIDQKTFRQVVSEKRDYKRWAREINQAEKEISECKGTILKDENQIVSLTPWLSLDVPMSESGTKMTAVLIGTMPGVVTEEELFSYAAKDLDDPAVTVKVLSSSSEQTCVAAVCLKRDSGKVEENLRAKGFARPAQMVKRLPREVVEDLKKDIEVQNGEIERLKQMIASYADKREGFRISADYYRTREEKYKLLGTIPQSENVFFLEGWVTADSADQIIRLLTDRFGAYVEKEETREDDEEPTVLRNNRFSRSVEGVLESYGLPTKGHVDPTFIMSFFYVFFFGMMLSDGGYGLIMAIACGIILLKYKRIEEGLKKMLTLFFWCGVSTAFWGFMYGGFFGDLIDTVAKTFFGYTGEATLLPPLWFAPLTDPMKLLVWCMLFGMIHLFTGLGIKGYELLKRGDIVGFISDILAWYLFVLGLILLLLPSSLFESISGMQFNFPEWLATAAKAMTIIGALIILVMSGRSQKNPAIRIALGAYDLYGITSWLSDALSYSRLLALGLATGVIASVINLMAGMVAKGNGFIGVIIFILIELLGHTLNIGINALGAYVHTNRLQYVEFFGKFYDAGGRAFKPFKTANQYIEVKEEK